MQDLKLFVTHVGEQSNRQRGKLNIGAFINFQDLIMMFFFNLNSFLIITISVVVFLCS